MFSAVLGILTSLYPLVLGCVWPGVWYLIVSKVDLDTLLQILNSSCLLGIIWYGKSVNIGLYVYLSWRIMCV